MPLINFTTDQVNEGDPETEGDAKCLTLKEDANIAVESFTEGDPPVDDFSESGSKESFVFADNIGKDMIVDSNVMLELTGDPLKLVEEEAVIVPDTDTLAMIDGDIGELQASDFLF